jgi:hypothetical protein
VARLNQKQLETLARAELRKRLEVCRRLGVTPDGLSLESVTRELKEMPQLADELWQALPEYEPTMSYEHIYGTPRDAGRSL